jgi:threonine/homoserine/homoserine lactone efflux protein
VPELSTLAVFAVAALGLLIVPGPAVTYIVARSVDQGRTAGLVSTAGIHVGTLVHVIAAVVGLSALLVSSAVAYTAVKWAGAAYLIVLGVLRLVRGGGSPADDVAPPPAALRRVFWQAVVVNVLNPKTALFFLALLPQFVDPDHGAASLQLFVLGMTFLVLGLCTDSTYALLAARAGSALRGSRVFAGVRRWLTGIVYVALGAKAATS